MERRYKGPSLRQGMDRDIYQIVRKLEDQQSSNSGGAAARLSVAFVYDSIKSSNSSYARQKRRPLEDAIERVLALRKEELRAQEEDSEDDSDELLEAAIAAKPRAPGERDSASLLNRQMVKGWNFAASSSSSTADGAAKAGGAAAAAAVTDGESSKVERQANGEPKTKKRKAGPGREAEKVDRSPPTHISIDDMAGVSDAAKQAWRSVVIPLQADEDCSVDYRSSTGVLLHGPSGCGKTAFANAVAAEAGKAFISVLAPSLVGGTSGESEKNIRDIFDEAIRLAPTLVFFDDIDIIAGKRDGASKAMEVRMVTELTNGMDRIKRDTAKGRHVIIMAATSRPESLDVYVRRRFQEIELPMPNQDARASILRSMTRDLPLADDVDFDALAKMTPGFVGSDLSAVVLKARDETLEPIFQQALETAQATNTGDLTNLDEGQRELRLGSKINSKDFNWSNMCIAFNAFERAAAKVQPASKREGFTSIPDTTWSDVGALHEARRRLERNIVGPINNPKLYASINITAPDGILLWGPPGCGKTLVAKAVANESKASFISVKGAELLNKYVGESERAVRQLFERARRAAPCVLFFDEIDALVPRRGDANNDASVRVVNAMLTELNGVGDRTGVYVVGATNRPDMIDPAMTRPGRLGTRIYVGLPTPGERAEILQTLCRPRGGDGDKSRPVPPELLAGVARDRRCEGFTGADLEQLRRAAGFAAIDRILAVPEKERPETVEVTPDDWERALQETKPSVQDIEQYTEMRFDS